MKAYSNIWRNWNDGELNLYIWKCAAISRKWRQCVSLCKRSSAPCGPVRYHSGHRKMAPTIKLTLCWFVCVDNSTTVTFCHQHSANQRYSASPPNWIGNLFIYSVLAAFGLHIEYAKKKKIEQESIYHFRHAWTLRAIAPRIIQVNWNDYILFLRRTLTLHTKWINMNHSNGALCVSARAWAIQLSLRDC